MRIAATVYQLVARFLAEVRAVPLIIEASFGKDRGNALMRAFSAQFEAHRSAIDTHPLTTERDVAEHRLLRVRPNRLLRGGARPLVRRRLRDSGGGLAG